MKLPGLGRHGTAERLAAAFTVQELDLGLYPDSVRFFISMKYVHGLSAVGGVHSAEGPLKILFYREPDFTPSASRLKEPVELVEESQFALLLPGSVGRADFEQKINMVQMELHETYMAQTVLAIGSEFFVLCQNVGDAQEYLTHSMLRIPQEVQAQLQNAAVSVYTRDGSQVSLGGGVVRSSARSNTERRELFMQAISSYLHQAQDRFGWTLFEAIVSSTSDSPLQDSFFVFRK